MGPVGEWSTTRGATQFGKGPVRPIVRSHPISRDLPWSTSRHRRLTSRGSSFPRRKVRRRNKRNSSTTIDPPDGRANNKHWLAPSPAPSPAPSRLHSRARSPPSPETVKRRKVPTTLSNHGNTGAQKCGPRDVEHRIIRSANRTIVIASVQSEPGDFQSPCAFSHQGTCEWRLRHRTMPSRSTFLRNPGLGYTAGFSQSSIAMGTG